MEGKIFVFNNLLYELNGVNVNLVKVVFKFLGLEISVRVVIVLDSVGVEKELVS